MEKQAYKILILVPSYNSAVYLPRLIPRIQKCAPSADLLIIDDGSSDNTDSILRRLDVNILTNNPNQGKGYTLRLGYDYAIDNGYDYIIQLDADLQHLPEELPRFIKRAGEADLYMGTRDLSAPQMPPHRKLSNYMTSYIISLFSKFRMHDTQSGYRMISIDLIKRIRMRSFKYDFESEFLFRAGRLDIKYAEIPISTIYEGAPSSVHPIRDTLRFVRLIWQRIWGGLSVDA